MAEAIHPPTLYGLVAEFHEPTALVAAAHSAYDNGYREGTKEGERDARRRDDFNYQDERTWQRADKGYHRSFRDFGPQPPAMIA